MLASAAATWIIIHQATTEPSRSGTIPSPEAVLLTDQVGVSASYGIRYYAGATTNRAGTTFNIKRDDLPTDVREFQFTFQSGRPRQAIRYAILLNADAAMTNATSVNGLGEISASAPGPEIESDCNSIASFPTGQVLSGTVMADQAGVANVSLVGGIGAKYERIGERTAVNVIQLLPGLNSNVNASAGGCNANLVNWEEVGGIAWQSPRYGPGMVTIGDVLTGEFVESSNPPITNARSLTWQLQGPATVTYTLFNTDVQSGHEILLFAAGLIAAAAVALFVEVLKGIGEMFKKTEPEGANQHLSTARGSDAHGESGTPQPTRTPTPIRSRTNRMPSGISESLPHEIPSSGSRQKVEASLIVGALILVAWRRWRKGSRQPS